MGKKKSFIDKKRSTTYTLVFRSAADEQDDEANAEADRVLVPAGELGGAGREDQPPSDPRALYAHFFGDDDDAEQEDIPEARRKELLQFGFPDDGYDYLKHCRVIGRGAAAMHANQSPAAAPSSSAAAAGSSSSAAAAAIAAEATASQSVFLRAPRVRAPDADVKLVDARRIAAATAAAADDSAAEDALAGADAPVLQVLSEVAAPAAARRIGGKDLAAELAELEQLMEAAEGVSEDGEADEQGVGDLLDDFVLTAAAGASGAAAAAAAVVPAAAEVAGSDMSDEEEDEEFSSESDDEQQQQQQRVQASVAAAAAAPAGASSRGNDAYDMLNEQFDHLLSAYDDEQLGDLEGDDRTAGRLGPAQLQALVAQGQQQQQQQQQWRSKDCAAPANGTAVHREDEFEEDDEFPSEGHVDVGFKGTQIGGLGFVNKVESFADKDEAVIAAVRARLAAQEAAAAKASSSNRGAAGGILEDEEITNVYLPAEKERWDCESVLSMRSNISHFPAKIASESGHRRQRGASSSAAAAAGGSGVIKLNAKTGLPSGYGAASMAAAAAAAAATAAAAAGVPQRLSTAMLAAAAAGDDDSGSEGAAELDGCSMATSIYERPKGESAEERRARKAAVKELQRDARATKKQLKQMYASEASRQQRQQAAAPKAAVFAIP